MFNTLKFINAQSKDDLKRAIKKLDRNGWTFRKFFKSFDVRFILFIKQLQFWR